MNALTLTRPMRGHPRASGPTVSPLITEHEVRRADDRRFWAEARRWIADACYVSLILTRWVSVTLLATLGLYVLLVLALGDFTAVGAFAHLDNLARRFLEATPERQASFLRTVGGVSLLLFAVLASFRWHALTIHFAPGKGHDHG